MDVYFRRKMWNNFFKCIKNGSLRYFSPESFCMRKAEAGNTTLFAKK